MGANRALRRKQARDQMHEWVRTGQAEQVRRLVQNGITQKDLDDCYDKGHLEGFRSGTEQALRTVYAGIVLEMLDAGNSREEALSFLKGVDERMLTSIDAGEDLDEVFKRTGVHLLLKDRFDRVREVAE